MPQTRISLPPADFLRACFIYRVVDGVFIWRERPDHHFASPATAKAWNAKFAGTVAGRKTKFGYLQVALTYKGREMRLYVHRIAFFLVTGEQPDDVDHENRDRSDNRYLNLRAATRQQNRRNSRSKNDLPKGVHWDAKRRKFCAQICVDRKTKNLGRYSTAEHAHQAYRRAAEPLYGEFFRAG